MKETIFKMIKIFKILITLLIISYSSSINAKPVPPGAGEGDVPEPAEIHRCKAGVDPLDPVDIAVEEAERVAGDVEAVDEMAGAIGLHPDEVE